MAIWVHIKILDFITKHFNEYIDKVEKNIKQINDTFLLKVFLDMDATGSAFWKIDELTIIDKMPDDCDNIYEPYWNEMSRLEQEYAETANDGSIQKEDIEKILRKNYPMFNFEAFIEGIVPEVVCLSEDGLSFQCSDRFGDAILCGAYDELDENLCFTEWHNF